MTTTDTTPTDTTATATATDTSTGTTDSGTTDTLAAAVAATTLGLGGAGAVSDLLATLAQHRHLLRHTTRGLSDAQAATRSTVSELTLSGLVEHVTESERGWVDFLLHGPGAMDAQYAQYAQYAEGTGAGEGTDEGAWDAPEAGTEPPTTGEPASLAVLLDAYAEQARSTEAAVRALPDLDATTALPAAPWFPPGASWSARRVLLHLVAETCQHAGHADIIRESIDGAKTMG